MLSFKTRIDTPERLDTGDYTPEEYARWLGEMRYIHGFFGELRALKKTLLKEIALTGEKRVAILDVGAGNGYLLGEIAKLTHGRHTFFTGADIGFESAISVRAFGAAAVQCDALRLPFGNDSFDHAFCTLFLHHLDDREAVKLLTEMARVSRGKIFVVDLNRDRTAYYLYKLFAPIFFQRLTVEDGALSILRSRTPDELRHLAEAASLQQIVIVHSRLNRLVLSGVGARDE
jgi:ubiquinone/menaquinone biosynthesis C-methylase UbiE